MSMTTWPRRTDTTYTPIDIRRVATSRNTGTIILRYAPLELKVQFREQGYIS